MARLTYLVARSTVTGRFVTVRYARRHHRTTVVTRRKKF